MEYHGQMVIYNFLFGVMSCPLLFHDIDVLLRYGVKFEADTSSRWVYVAFDFSCF